ncbi:MAG: hypothetical protein JXR05_04010 [Flavobacteriaceae bacterium]
MKQCIMLCLFLMIGVNTIAQIKFEKGYFIQDDGQKIECLIKNESWDMNNGSFQYKISENQNAIEKELGKINEITIYNTLKYQRYDVDIDVSISTINQLSADRNPKFRKMPLLLKVLLEGKATLYQYKEKKIVRFFYKTEEMEIPKQLVYKKYASTNNTVKSNNAYKQELAKHAFCKKEGYNAINRLTYSRTNLEKYFKKYNECSNANYTFYEEFNDTKRLFLKAKAGISSSSFSTSKIASNFLFGYDIDFGSKIIPFFGFELEYFLPTKGNKWSLFIDPKFRSFKISTVAITSNSTVFDNSEKVDFNYKSIEIPIGFRYYTYLKSNSKLSFSLGFMLESGFKNSGFNFEKQVGNNDLLETNAFSINNLVYGIGYHKDKYAIELKYNARSVIKTTNLWDTKYQNIDLSFSYILF